MLLRETLLVVGVDNPLRKTDDVLFGLSQTLGRNTQRPDRRRAVGLDRHVKVLGLHQLTSSVDTASGARWLNNPHVRWLEQV